MIYFNLFLILDLVNEIAQLVEQWNHNPPVVSSILAFIILLLTKYNLIILKKDD